MKMADDAFKWLDFDLEEAVQYNKEQDNKNHQRDNRICICGHPISRHNHLVGAEHLIECKPTAMTCRCKQEHIRPVIEVSDMRDFLRKTTGNGKMHALGRGMAASFAKGHKVEWIVPISCDGCGATDVQVSPVNVDANGLVRDRETGISRLLCSVCRTEV